MLEWHGRDGTPTGEIFTHRLDFPLKRGEEKQSRGWSGGEDQPRAGSETAHEGTSLSVSQSENFYRCK